MARLLIGLGFVLLDITVRAGSATIGLLPDFIGYVLILRAFDTGAERFRVPRALISLFLALSVGVFFLHLFAGASWLRFLAWALDGVLHAAALTTAYLLARGIQRLKPVFLCQTALTVLGWLCAWIPLVGTAAAVAAFAVNAAFIVLFYQSVQQ